MVGDRNNKSDINCQPKRRFQQFTSEWGSAKTFIILCNVQKGDHVGLNNEIE
jgi:hypothetical protein